MIRKPLPESSLGRDQDLELAALLDEQAAFEQMRPSLREDDRYRDKYVAIRQHAVVDCDVDKFQLGRRMTAQYPEDVVLIANVPFDDPPVELPSPEIES